MLQYSEYSLLNYLHYFTVSFELINCCVNIEITVIYS